MPPTDPVFTNPSPPNTSSAAGAPAQGTPAPATGTQAAQVATTQPDLEAQIAKALEPLVTSVRAQEKFMGSVADHLQNQPAPGTTTGSGEAPEGEFWNKFTANPETAIDDRFNKVAAPLIGQLASSHVKGQIDKYRGEIDSAWGEGAFDAHIKDDLNSIVNRALSQNSAAVLNTEALETTRDALIGRKVVGLAAHKEKAQATGNTTRQTEIEAAVQAAFQKHGIDPTTLSGGIRRVSPTSEKLPDEFNEYLAARLRDTGEPIDQRRAAKMMNTGASYSDWLKADAELEARK